MNHPDQQAAVMVQMAIIAEERRQNAQHHDCPPSSWGPYSKQVDKTRCDWTHSDLSRKQLSKLPSSTSSVPSWGNEVRSK